MPPGRREPREGRGRDQSAPGAGTPTTRPGTGGPCPGKRRRHRGRRAEAAGARRRLVGGAAHHGAAAAIGCWRRAGGRGRQRRRRRARGGDGGRRGRRRGASAADPQPAAGAPRGQRHHHLLQPPRHLPRDVVRRVPVGARLLALLPPARRAAGALHAAPPQVRPRHVPEPPAHGRRGTHHGRHPHKCRHRRSVPSGREENDPVRSPHPGSGPDLLRGGGLLPADFSHPLAPLQSPETQRTSKERAPRCVLSARGKGCTQAPFLPPRW